MIQCKSVTKSFGSQVLLDEVTFHINAGERVGLVGRNGHGKTTLLNIILGKDAPDEGEIMKPEHYVVGYLEQHLNFTRPNIVEEAALGLREHQKHDLWRAEKMLHGLGFKNEDLKKAPEDFSGGYQIRIQLAKTLLGEPDLLLLDEPTNYLDIVSLRWLSRFLNEWQGELLLVTHDRNFMDSVTTHTMAIHRQGIKKLEGSTSKIYRQISQEEEIHERTRLNDEKKAQKTEKFIREFRAGARSAGLVQSRIKALEKREKKEKLEAIAQIKFRFEALEFHSDRMIQGTNLTFGYDTKDLFSKVDLRVEPGDKVAIIGKNGKGKSTLLKCLSEDLSLRAGSLKCHPDLQKVIFNQSNEKVLESQKTILETLQESVKDMPETSIRALCGSLMFRGGEVYKKIEVLSGGEKNRVALGKVMLQPRHLLLLDEPTNHLDLESVEALIQAMKNFSGGIVFVSHNEDVLRQVANKFIVFEGDYPFGFQGSYDDFLREKGWQDEAEESVGEPKKRVVTNDLKLQKKQLEKDRRRNKKIVDEIEKRIAKIEDDLTENKEKFKVAERQGARLKMEDLGIEYQRIHEKLIVAYAEWDQAAAVLEKSESSLADLLES